MPSQEAVRKHVQRTLHVHVVDRSLAVPFIN